MPWLGRILEIVISKVWQSPYFTLDSIFVAFSSAGADLLLFLLLDCIDQSSLSRPLPLHDDGELLVGRLEPLLLPLLVLLEGYLGWPGAVGGGWKRNFMITTLWTVLHGVITSGDVGVLHHLALNPSVLFVCLFLHFFCFVNFSSCVWCICWAWERKDNCKDFGWYVWYDIQKAWHMIQAITWRSWKRPCCSRKWTRDWPKARKRKYNFPWKKLTNLDLDQEEKEDKEEEPRSADLLKIKTTQDF